MKKLIHKQIVIITLCLYVIGAIGLFTLPTKTLKAICYITFTIPYLIIAIKDVKNGSLP